MGIQDFNVAPDNKGGRPPKSEQEKEEEKGIVKGRPYVDSEADEEWWEEVLDHVVGEGSVPGDSIESKSKHITDISDYTHLQPPEVWKQLEEHEMVDVDWDEYKEVYGTSGTDSRIPGVGSEPGSGSFSSGSSESETTATGLKSIIDAAK